MNRVWFTADLHLGHAACIQYDWRPFKDVREHDEFIIKRWNETVKNNEEVWIIGDLCFRNEMPATKYIELLNGRLNMIRGNHDDKEAWKHREQFRLASEAAYIRLDHERIYMHHYPCLTWRNSHHGSWHLHGHCHGHQPEGYPVNARILDVGLMMNDYRPWELQEIRQYMQGRGIMRHHPQPEEDSDAEID